MNTRLSSRHLASGAAATVLAAFVATSLYLLAAETHKHVSLSIQWKTFFSLATGQLSLQHACYHGFSSYDPDAVFCIAAYHYYIANLLLSPSSIVVIALLSWFATYNQPSAAVTATVICVGLAASLIYISPFVDNSFYALKELVYAPKELGLQDMLLLPNAITVEVMLTWLVTYLLWTAVAVITLRQGPQS